MKKAMFAAGLAMVGLSGGVSDGVAQTTLIEKYFDNWKVECRDDEKTKNCAMVYALLNNQTKRVVFSWTLAPDDEAKNADRILIRTPTGVLLPDGVAVTFPGAEPITVAYRTCGRRGCIAELDLNEQWLKALGSQETMAVSYKSVRGKEIKHDVKLEKFNDAYQFFKSERGSE